MEIREMSVQELEERKAQIATEVENPEADLNALEEEVRAINAEIEERANEEAKKAEIRSAVAAGEGEVTEVIEEVVKTEERKMTNMEVRNTAEYVDAFAEYIKSENDAECRALLTENVSGSVPVPSVVEDIVRHAWENEGIMSQVRKTYIKGNLRVGFEISGTDAAFHTEGGEAVAEETLVLGVVTIQPRSIKKWISISDEVYDLRGEAFLQYIYEELAYRIAKKAADEVIVQIEACGTVSTTTCVGVPKVVQASIAQETVVTALGQLSDEVNNPAIIMNKQTYAAFKGVQYGGNYSTDIFEGCKVIFNNTITAYSAATTGQTYAIVGDLGGVTANFPNGQGIDFKFDEMSKKKEDLVEILGREYVGIGVTQPGAFVKITK